MEVYPAHSQRPAGPCFSAEARARTPRPPSAGLLRLTGWAPAGAAALPARVTWASAVWAVRYAGNDLRWVKQDSVDRF